MTQSARSHIVLFAIVQCISAGSPAIGFSDTSESTAAATDEATVHFQQGIEFYKQQKFEAASIEFGRAYELKPSYKILYNIAQAENMLEHYAAALTAYRTYLEQGSAEIPQDRKTVVTDEIARLLTRVGYVEVKGAAAGASILIDGEERGTTPLSTPITVDIGKREVEISADTTRLFRRIYPVAGGQHVVVDLSPSAPTEAGPKPTEDRASGKDTVNPTVASPSPGKGRKVAGALLLGVGLAAGATGAITGGISISKRTTIETGCDGFNCDADTWGDEFDTVHNLSIATDVLLGTAVASVTAGLILLLVKPKKENAAAISGGVSPLENGAFAAVSGRF